MIKGLFGPSSIPSALREGLDESMAIHRAIAGRVAGAATSSSRTSFEDTLKEKQAKRPRRPISSATWRRSRTRRSATRRTRTCSREPIRGSGRLCANVVDPSRHRRRGPARAVDAFAGDERGRDGGPAELPGDDRREHRERADDAHARGRRLPPPDRGRGGRRTRGGEIETRVVSDPTPGAWSTTPAIPTPTPKASSSTRTWT